MSDTGKTGTKAVLLVLGSYLATIGVTVGIVVLVVVGLETHTCSEMGRALVMLWKTIAGVFLASVVVVGVVARRIVPGVAGRWAIAVAYAVVMMATYVVVGFGLMVAFNC